MSSAPGPPLDMSSLVEEPRLSFWDLPRELRDMIYEEYATIDGGYIFNPDSGKLRPAKPHAHPLALQRTCKRATLEMTGLALSLNTVTFSTVATMREAAFRFDFMFRGLHRQLHSTACYAFDHDYYTYVERPSPAVLASVRETVLREFPEFRPAFDALDMDIPYGVWSRDLFHAIDVEPSRLRKFYQLLAYRFVTALPQPHAVHRVPLPDNSLVGEAWDIPSKERLDRMADAWRPMYAQYEDEYGTPVIELDRIWEKNRFKYRFSAAAAAIQFLRRHPSCLPHMRRLVLNEDRESVAYPESHGKGLIPFCNENPLLRIERRLDFVRSVIVANSGLRPCLYVPWTKRLKAHGNGIPDDEAGNKKRAFVLHEAEELYQGWHDRWPDVGVQTKDLTTCLVNWIREASALPASISLLLDGNSAPEQATHVFRHWVIPLAIWQEALETSYRRGLLPKSEDINAPRPWWEDTGSSWPEYLSLRSDTKEFTLAWWFWRAFPHDESEGEGFVAPGFPERIRDIISGSGQVHCNFHVDPLLQADVEKLIMDHRDCSKEGWYDNKMRRESYAVIDVWRAPMKPVLGALMREDALPKGEGVGSG